MLKLLTLFLVIFISHVSKAEDVPSLVIELFRHGARSPSQAVDKTWQDHDELTPVGMRQHYILGSILAERYSNLLQVYDTHNIYVRSTNYNRTIMSALSQLQGIFKETGPSLPIDSDANQMVPPFADTVVLDKILEELKQEKGAVPKNLQLVPIHSVRLENDDLLYNGPSNCPASSIWFKKQTNDDKTSKIYNSLESTTKHLRDAGYTFEQLFDYFVLGDTVISNHFANKALPKGITYNDEYYKDIVYGFQWFTNYVYGGTGTQLRAFSFTLVNQIITWLNNKASNKNEPLNFIMLAAHDTTLLHLLGLFDIVHPDCLAANQESRKKKEPEPFPQCIYPGYASQIFIEFYNPENVEPYIKFIYNSDVINICKTDDSKCTLKNFQKLATDLVDLTPEQYLSICSLPNNNGNMGEVIKIIIITVVIVVLLLLALFGAYLYLKKRQGSQSGDYTKVDKEVDDI